MKQVADKEFEDAIAKHKATTQKISLSLEETIKVNDGLEFIKLLMDTPPYLESKKVYKKAFEAAKVRYREKLVNQLTHFDALCSKQGEGDLDKATYEMRMLFLGESFIVDEGS